MRVTKSIYAGICISMGCVAYLKLCSIGQQILGAALFSIGLLAVLGLEFHLFTGKMCDLRWIVRPVWLFLCLIGNAIGCCAAAILFKNIEGIGDLAKDVVESKMSRSLASTLSGAILCDILIAIAVHTKNVYVCVMTVMIFLLCGGEHIVADLFYFFVAGVFDYKFLGTVLFGNIIGGLLFSGEPKVKEEISK